MKIRSTKELFYDSRNNKKAIIELEISNWNYNIKRKSYTATIIDSYVNTDNNGVETLKNIDIKNKRYTVAEVNGLFQALSVSIDINTPYNDQMDSLLQNALLLVTKQEPIYGSEASDWEVYNN